MATSHKNWFTLVCTINCKIQSLGGGSWSCWIQLAYIYICYCVLFSLLYYILLSSACIAVQSCTPPPPTTVPYMVENTISVACGSFPSPKTIWAKIEISGSPWCHSYTGQRINTELLVHGTDHIFNQRSKEEVFT